MPEDDCELHPAAEKAKENSSYWKIQFIFMPTWGWKMSVWPYNQWHYWFMGLQLMTEKVRKEEIFIYTALAKTFSRGWVRAYSAGGGLQSDQNGGRKGFTFSS